MWQSKEQLLDDLESRMVSGKIKVKDQTVHGVISAVFDQCNLRLSPFSEFTVRDLTRLGERVVMQLASS